MGRLTGLGKTDKRMKAGSLGYCFSESATATSRVSFVADATRQRKGVTKMFTAFSYSIACTWPSLVYLWPEPLSPHEPYVGPHVGTRARADGCRCWLSCGRLCPPGGGWPVATRGCVLSSRRLKPVQITAAGPHAPRVCICSDATGQPGAWVQELSRSCLAPVCGSPGRRCGSGEELGHPVCCPPSSPCTPQRKGGRRDHAQQLTAGGRCLRLSRLLSRNGRLLPPFLF